MTTFTFFNDPGHGWLQVDWSDLKRLGFNPTDFSRCSYRRRNTFFLEEDCDAPRFLKAYEAKHGNAPTVYEQHTNGDSFIRSLPSIY